MPFVFRRTNRRCGGATPSALWLESFPPIRSFSLTADEIVGCSDLAFVRGTYALTVAPQAGAAPQTDRGHYMGLLRKQADGLWLWTTDMISSELPLPR